LKVSIYEECKGETVTRVGVGQLLTDDRKKNEEPIKRRRLTALKFLLNLLDFGAKMIRGSSSEAKADMYFSPTVPSISFLSLSKLLI